jgi:hypothetical protein
MNSAISDAGAVRHTGDFGSPPLIMNCIFWENDAPTGRDINNITSESITVSYSDIETSYINGPWAGEENIDADPLFEGSDTAYYQLSGGSLCIDAGTPDTTGLNLPPWDYIYNIRLYDGDGDQDTIIDMGAYEYGSIQHGTVIDQFKIPFTIENIQAFPNPTRGIFNLQFTVNTLQTISIIIYDLFGREMAVVMEKKLLAGDQVLKYDISGLPSGIYLCMLTTDRRQLAASRILKID